MITRLIPSGWKLCTINEIISDNGLFSDGDWIESKDQDPFGDVKLIQLADVNDGVFQWKSNKYLTSEKATELECTYLVKGDILVARMPDPIGRACIFPGKEQKCITAVDVCILRPENHEINCKWLMYAINSPEIRKQIYRLSRGTTRKRISRTDFGKIELIIPPITLQRRIVEILEQADALRHLRAQADAETQILLQSVFYEMFGDPVRNEKGWELVKLKEICEEVTVGIVVKPASYYVKDGVPAFRSLNIKEDALNLDNLVHISPDDNNTVLSKSKLKTGDILVVRTGNPGTSCVVPVDFNGANCIDLIIIRPNRDRINSQYLSKFLNSEYGKAQSLASNTGLAQQHLNVRNIREMIIPLPPLHLQQQFSYIKENIERNRDVQAKSKQEIERLFEGLMTVAFTGELN